MAYQARQLTDAEKEIVLNRIREGESLRFIEKWSKIPRLAVLRALEESEDFQTRYARAREAQAEYYAEMIVEAANEQPPMILDQFGNARIDPAWASIQKNKIDALKWQASKLKPKVYGDSTTLKGDKDNPLANFGAVLDAVSRKIEERKAKMLENEQKPVMIDITPEQTTEEVPI